MQPVLTQTTLDCQNMECFPYIHATLMSAAWMFFAGLGIITARHYRPVLGHATKWDTWYPVHVASMITVLFCTVAGFVIIFVAKGDIVRSPEALTLSHVVLGIVTTFLCILNPFMAICRCNPKHPYRPVFNYAHYAVGMLAHACGVVTIAIGVSDPRFNALVTSAEWTRYTFYVYVAVHFLTMISLEIINCCTRRCPSNAYAMGDSTDQLVNQPTHTTGGNKLKLWIYGSYFWVVLGLTLMTLIGLWNPVWINTIIVPSS